MTPSDILDWIFADSRRELFVQGVFMAGGALAVVCGLVSLVRSKLRHEVLPRELAVESDHRALRIFAAVIFGLEIFCVCWNMTSSRYDLSEPFLACVGWLTVFGVVVAVRSRHWRYVLLLLVEFFLAGALIPASTILGMPYMR